MQELRKSGGRFCWFVVLVYHRKVRLRQLWVELSWVVANTQAEHIGSHFSHNGLFNLIPGPDCQTRLTAIWPYAYMAIEPYCNHMSIYPYGFMALKGATIGRVCHGLPMS